jgi:hypothetical protein
VRQPLRSRAQVERVAVPVQHRQAVWESGEKRIARTSAADPPPTNRPRARRPLGTRGRPRRGPTVARRDTHRASAGHARAQRAAMPPRPAGWQTRRRSRPTSARPSPRHRRTPRRREQRNLRRTCGARQCGSRRGRARRQWSTTARAPRAAQSGSWPWRRGHGCAGEGAACHVRSSLHESAVRPPKR